jgi:hypothetical protein
LGIFSYAQRNFVIDAFHWNPKTEPLAIPAFDPVARAKDLSSPPATSDALRIVKSADSRDAALIGTPADESAAGAIVLQGGTSTLTGTVTGPSGPVAGATVRIERFIGEDSGVMDVTTGGGGTFAFGNAPGGRYRVRAWRAPGLAQLSSDVVFIAEGERKNFSLQLQAPAGRSVNVDGGASGWRLGGSPVITVSVNEPYVTSQGKVGLTGTSGLPVSLNVGGGLTGSASGATNSSGNASFTVNCSYVGLATAQVVIGSYSRWVDLPPCSPPPTTTTTPAPPPQPPTPATPAPSRAGG